MDIMKGNFLLETIILGKLSNVILAAKEVNINGMVLLYKFHNKVDAI